LIFEKTTGIIERRVAKDGITCSDFCYNAAKNLLNDLSIDLSEIDVLIFVSQSPDYFFYNDNQTNNKITLMKNRKVTDGQMPSYADPIYGGLVTSSMPYAWKKRFGVSRTGVNDGMYCEGLYPNTYVNTTVF
jgi:3-oxoacyl-[acyl-carrier-protein] synthase III